MIKPTAAAAGLLLLAGCSDPLRTVPRLGDVEVDAPTPVVEAVAAPVETDAKSGLFARLLRKREIGPTDPAASAEGTEPAVAAPESTADANPDAPDLAVAAAAPDAPQKRGFLGLFSRDKARRLTQAPGDSVETAGTGAGDAARVTPAALSEPAPDTPSATAHPQAQPQADPQAQSKPRGGLFSREKASRVSRKSTGPDARDALPGEVLPFGTVARACHMKGAQLGREIAKYPEKRTKYRVYDSAPGYQGLHTFYVTGFSDGCPRQVTAALAVFGSASMYEALRYGLPEGARTGKPTDTAYEKLKSKVCKVGRKKPCGASIARMEKQAVFLSVYNRFEGADGWSNLLIADGEVLAMDAGS